MLLPSYAGFLIFLQMVKSVLAQFLHLFRVLKRKLGLYVMSERGKIQGEYLCLTLDLLNALENRDFDRAYLLRKKRLIFDPDAKDQTHQIRKMEAYIFDHLTYEAPSWIEALISYKELIENFPRSESLGFLWRGVGGMTNSF